MEVARTHSPDLYLFDIDMPRLDGLGAARALAAEGLRRPVVVLTGVEDPGLVDRSVSSGVSAYLTKPIDDRQLDAAIRLASARHRELLDLEEEVQRARQKPAEHRKPAPRKNLPVVPGSQYLALGDSVTFGYEEAGVVPPPDYHNAASFVNYPQLVGRALHLKVANAACSGETSSSLINPHA